MGDGSRTNWLKHRAMEIASQLPEDPKDAKAVLDYAAMILNFVHVVDVSDGDAVLVADNVLPFCDRVDKS